MPAEMTKEAFVERFGSIYEHSPWVAEAVWPDYIAGRLDRPGSLSEAMRNVVEAATYDMKLALIRAHPELAGRARMADASVKEQSKAGLDQCTPEEFDAFQTLNMAYKMRFGFPFIVAVKGMSRQDILAIFERRLGNGTELEFETAMSQIHRIASFRLADLT
jgi:2-oxo-4-hydroxy-4-carboxy-5-ureidoimidazoline decarboxylase